MIDTDGYLRFERVDAVEETARGLLARRCTASGCAIDVVRDDVVRVKISRGGVFDEAPTFAVCVDPLGRARRVRGRARTTASSACAPPRMVVSLWLDPFRLDVHRPDGSAVVETAARRRGPLLGVRDAQRRVHAPPPLPPRGRDLRAGREDRPPQPQGPRLHAVEHRRARPARDRASSPPAAPPATRARTARARSSTRTTSRSRSSTTRRTRPGAMAASFVDNGYRGALRVLAPRGVPRSTSPAASTPSTSSPGRGCPTILDGLHLADRAHRAAAAVGARLPPVPLVRLHPGRGRGARRSATATRGIPCDALWLDIEYMDGYRVFTWDTEAFPDAGGHARSGCASRASG